MSFLIFLILINKNFEPKLVSINIFALFAFKQYCILIDLYAILLLEYLTLQSNKCSYQLRLP